MNHEVFRIAICDDEPTALFQIQDMTERVLRQAQIAYTITSFSSCETLLHHQKASPSAFHLLLLDIMMEGLNGMEFARKLRQAGDDVMLLLFSANPEFALQGYEVEAIRFLAKPIQEKRLQEALFACYRHQMRQKEILIKSETGYHRISLPMLDYVEVAGRGTLLHMDSECMATAEKISALESRLTAAGFIRCHQGFLVNLRAVRTLRRYELVLNSGKTIPVSKLRFDETRRQFLKYLHQ